MLEVKVCVGTSCSFKGALDILEHLENDSSLEGKINIEHTQCFNKACKPNESPVIMIDGQLYTKMSLGSVLTAIQEKLNGK
jgi:NADH:ubiquinone oxidoreductase subunit E